VDNPVLAAPATAPQRTAQTAPAVTHP
jgi:hypothetical protein